jgi:hypothetical protein
MQCCSYSVVTIHGTYNTISNVKSFVLDTWLRNIKCMQDFSGELLEITCKTKKVMTEQY